MSDTNEDSSSASEEKRAYIRAFGPMTAIRPGENPITHWMLLSGNRLAVTGVLLLAVFVAIIALAVVKPFELRRLVSETGAARTLFNTLLAGAILLVSIVASINSTALSQEISDIEGQHDRINAAIEYRRKIEKVIPYDVSPTQPAEFLSAILGAIAHETQGIADTAVDHPDDRFERTVDAFVDEVAADLEQARETLRNASAGSFDVLLAGLNYDYAGQLHATRRFKYEFGESMDEEENELIDDLIETLEFFATGREYFKSLYYEQELAKLSSQLLYVSLPVIVFTSYIIFALSGTLVPEMTFMRISSLLLVVSFAYTVALAPYLILTAYVVRLSTVTLRTLASGPFFFQQQSGIDVFESEAPSDPYEWDLPRKDN